MKIIEHIREKIATVQAADYRYYTNLFLKTFGLMWVGYECNECGRGNFGYTRIREEPVLACRYCLQRNKLPDLLPTDLAA